MSYQCPYKGGPKAVKQCERDPETIRGWKYHMTRQHDGYDESQLAAIVGATPPDAERGRSLFLAEADETPGQDKETGLPPGEGRTEDGPTVSAPEPAKRVQFKSKKLKKFFSSIPQVFLKAKGIEADADDMELIDTATEMLEEMFGVAFEVPDTQWVIKSRWLALLFPLGAMGIVWAKHSLPQFLVKMKEEKIDEEKISTP